MNNLLTSPNQHYVTIVSSHPLVSEIIKRSLFGPHSSFELLQPNCPDPLASSRLFIVDSVGVAKDCKTVCKEIIANSTRRKLIVLIAPDLSNLSALVDLLSIGVEGFVPMNDKWRPELVKAINAIMRDELWVDAPVQEAYFRRAAVFLNQYRGSMQLLTRRENEIVPMVIENLSNKQIGTALGISVRTVKHHISQILSKLNCANRRQLRHQLAGDGLDSFWIQMAKKGVHAGI